MRFERDPFSSFFEEACADVQRRVRLAVPFADSDDVIQNTWIGFWAWLHARSESDPSAHRGMLMQFADWRIASYFRDRAAAPPMGEMPLNVASVSASPLAEMLEADERRRGARLLELIANGSGGNVGRALIGAAQRRGYEDGGRAYEFVRAFLEHRLPSEERADVVLELLRCVATRHSLDAGMYRLVRMWNRLCVESDVPPLTRARAAPRRRRARHFCECLFHGPSVHVEHRGRKQFRAKHRLVSGCRRRRIQAIPVQRGGTSIEPKTGCLWLRSLRPS